MKNLKKFNLFEEVEISEVESSPKVENDEEDGDEIHNRFANYLVTKLKARYKNGYVNFYYTFDDDVDTKVTYYEFHWEFLNVDSLGYIQEFMKKETLFKCSLIADDDIIVLKIDVPEKYIEKYNRAHFNKSIMRTDYRLKKEDPTHIRPNEWRKETPAEDLELKIYRNRRNKKFNAAD